MNTRTNYRQGFGMLIAILLTGHAFTTSPCYADVFGAENPVKLPAISAKELQSVEKQLKRMLPKLKASVVRIETGYRGSFSSGVIINSEGIVLTHCHGGQIAGTIAQVYLADGRKVPAKYLGIHRNFDVALVQIEREGPWPFVHVGSAKMLSCGQCCFALGYPGGFSRTVSTKPVLRLSRILEVDPRLIYSNTPTEPGDSGGPMFNIKGEVIGIAAGLDRVPFTWYSRTDLLTEIYNELLGGATIEREAFAAALDIDLPKKETTGTRNNLLVTPNSVSSEGSDSFDPLSPNRMTLNVGQLAELNSKLEKQVGPALVAIFDQRTKRQVGSGAIIDASGLVLTHGTGIVGPKRIGRTFDVMVGSGKVTTGKYLGVNRAYRLSLMQLEKSEPWPVVRIGSPSDVKAANALVMLSCPAKLGNKRFRPKGHNTRALAVTNNRIYTPLLYPSGEPGAALFGPDGRLLGVRAQGSEFARADLYEKLKKQLLASKFVPKFRYPYAFGNLDISALPPVHKSVVRIMCDGHHVAFGVVVTEDGNIVTKASALTTNEIQCEFADGRKRDAKLLGRSHDHDLALLDVEANGLPLAEFAKRSAQGTILCTIGVQKVPLGAGVLGRGSVEVPSDKGQLGFEIDRKSLAPGVSVSKVLYALSRTVLKEADIITLFDDQVVQGVDDFDRAKKRYLQSERSFAGELVTATILRNGETLRVKIPVELEGEQNRSRPITDPMAPLLPDGLLGRHNGFPSVIVHDALVRTPCKVDSVEALTEMSRKHLGSPVVDLSGKVVGINIASHKGTFAYAIPADTVDGALRLIRKILISEE